MVLRSFLFIIMMIICLDIVKLIRIKITIKINGMKLYKRLYKKENLNP